MYISHSNVVKSVVSYFEGSKFADFFVDVEREIQMGSTVRRADIVLRDARGHFIAIAECKRPTDDVSGRLQLKSYLNATGTRFGLLATSTDRNRWVFCENKGGNRFREISRAAFEAGVLEEPSRVFTPRSVEAGKSQSVRIWRYAAGILGLGLLISIILLLMHSNTPKQTVQSSTQEQPVTRFNTSKQPAAQTSAPEQPATQEQLLTHLKASKQPAAQTSTPAEQQVMRFSTQEQLVTHLEASKQPAAAQTNTAEQPIAHTIDKGVLIPAGDFQMGGSDSEAESDEQPVHTVYVDAFYIDKYEVTNAQYKQFVDANPRWQQDNIPRYLHNGKYLKFWRENTYPPGKGNHPVVYVSWYAAMAYAKWVGRRLPTEAEWEKAARGGLVGAKYSWGDEIDSTRANYGGELGDAKPVGAYPPNDYGLYDMTGNVMEWCLDTYDWGFYNHSPLRNPIAGRSLSDTVNNFLNVSDLRVVRGGCWYNVPLHVRVADRYGTLPDDTSSGRGFRCASSTTSLPVKD